ncbi:MAG: thioredoxin family protein [Deltaproteobacteria bacterium]|nr:thioredoxin family protein [Deltaproteobacteria bacterium]
MKIKIMGPGCANCEKLAALAQQAVTETGSKAEIEKVSDFQEMARAGVMSTPALTIDGEIKCVGRVPDKEEIMAWLR